MPLLLRETSPPRAHAVISCIPFVEIRDRFSVLPVPRHVASPLRSSSCESSSLSPLCTMIPCITTSRDLRVDDASTIIRRPLYRSSEAGDLSMLMKRRSRPIPPPKISLADADLFHSEHVVVILRLSPCLPPRF